MQTEYKITRVQNQFSVANDWIAQEEPLEIRLGNPINRSLSVTMRTPGNDKNLALGFLWTEGIIKDVKSVIDITHCGPEQNGLQNIIKITFQNKFKIDMQTMQRNFYTTSSCGICGKSSIDALKTTSPFANLIHTAQADKDILHTLPAKLKVKQSTFDKTGGLHATGLFNVNGNLLDAAEDVGRHNALDKLIGEQLQNRALPLNNHILVLSGRASFELVQKAAMAGIGIIAAIGAPSSLAIELAAELNICLLGFLSETRFNIYTNRQRIRNKL